MKELTAEQYADIGKKFVNAMQACHEQLGGEAVEGQIELTSTDEDYPWLDKILEYEGMHEVEDNGKLRAFLSVNPDGTAWCADLVSQSLKSANKPALGLRARDYATYGEEGDGSVGDLAVWQGHIGVVVNENEVIGGNVSNEVKRSPHPGNHPDKDWFRGFIGFRKVV